MGAARARGRRLRQRDRARLPVGAGTSGWSAPDARGHRHRRQDHHDAAGRWRCWLPPGAASVAAGNTEIPLVTALDMDARRVRGRVHQLPLGAHRAVPWRGRGVAQPRPRPSQLAPVDGHLRRCQEQHLRQPASRRRGDRVRPRCRGDAPARRRPGPARHVRRVLSPTTASTGDALDRPGRRARARRDRCAGACPTTSPTAWPPPPSCSRAGSPDRTPVAAGLATFAGPPHRIELVGEVDGVAWYNDSKATTPHAASVAIAGFDTSCSSPAAATRASTCRRWRLTAEQGARRRRDRRGGRRGRRRVRRPHPSSGHPRCPTLSTSPGQLPAPATSSFCPLAAPASTGIRAAATRSAATTSVSSCARAMTQGADHDVIVRAGVRGSARPGAERQRRLECPDVPPRGRGPFAPRRLPGSRARGACQSATRRTSPTTPQSVIPSDRCWPCTTAGGWRSNG